MMQLPFDVIIGRQGHESCPGVRLYEPRPVRTVGDWQQTVMIYEPEEECAAPVPAFVFFHGGGFEQGHPAAAGRMAKTLALALGIKTFSFSYRLGTSQKPSYPHPVEDAEFAWQWMKDHAAEQGVDSNRLLLSGDSAGCCVAALALTTGRCPGALGFLGYWGPLDFIARWYDRGQTAGAERSLLGRDYEEDPVAYHQASPLTHVKRGLPPALFVYGRQDRVVHAHQGELGVAAWRSVGSRAELCICDRIGHAEGGDDPADVRHFLERTCTFVASLLGSGFGERQISYR